MDSGYAHANDSNIPKVTAVPLSGQGSSPAQNEPGKVYSQGFYPLQAQSPAALPNTPEVTQYSLPQIPQQQPMQSQNQVHGQNGVSQNQNIPLAQAIGGPIQYQQTPIHPAPQANPFGSPTVQTMNYNSAQYGTSVSQSVPTGKYYFMANRRELLIKQQSAWLEAAAQAIGLDCIEQENKYDIFDGVSGEPLFYVKEQSNPCIRCLCHPSHGAKLYVYDVKYPGFQKSNLPVTPGERSSLVMIVDKPFKFNCCICHDICRHEQTATLGSDGSIIGTANKEDPCGGYFTPVVDVKDANGQIYSKVEGPFCCVGGLIELFSSISFSIKESNGGAVVGQIQKKKPKGMEALQEAIGDSDQFFLSVPKTYDDQRAANFLATLLLMDYVFFEGGAPFEYNPIEQSCKINCFNCYCLGCVCPCHCEFGGQQNAEPI